MVESEKFCPRRLRVVHIRGENCAVQTSRNRTSQKKGNKLVVSRFQSASVVKEGEFRGVCGLTA